MRLVALGTPVRGAEAGGVVSWQGSVKDKDLTAPPGSPSTGDRYIVASVATGAWTGQEDDIAEWTGSAWSFDTPVGGWAVWVDDEKEIYVFDGSSWNQESLGPHAATHEDGGSDEVPVENLPTAGGAGTVVTGDGAGGLVMAMPGTPGNHAATHENGGIDEVGVAGLSGALADPQTPSSHATSHQDAGADEISVGGLNGELADDQPPKAHKATHQDGGADEMSVAALSGLLADAQAALSHASSHEDGGGDEISVAALSGLLADPQTPLAHLLVSAFHTASGLTPGDILTALTATTFGFQAAAVSGVVAKAIDHTWVGNDAADREIDLGDDYQFMIIFLEGNQVQASNHLAQAFAFKDVYMVNVESAVIKMIHRGGPYADPYFQGKMTGVDVNKILLGSSGTSSDGTNDGGKTYRLIGFKFSSME